MGMPADKFCDHVLQDVGNTKPAFFLGDLRMHHGQQDEVAELFPQILVVTCTDSRPDLVRLLDQPRKQGFISLLAVPRTAIGRAESSDNFAKLVEGRNLKVGSCRRADSRQ